MTPRLKDILDVLEEIAPSGGAEDWDNSGLQMGSPSQAIRKILVALDPTIQTVSAASEQDAQLLLTHHPLLFRPLSRLDLEAPPGDILFQAFRQGVAIVAAHTNLDVCRGGINDMLSEILGLREAEVLLPGEGPESGSFGLGRLGLLPAPLKFAAVVGIVKKALGVDKLRVAGREDADIRRVAVVGGKGGGLISAAVARGADLLVTGDIGHHEALEATASGLALIDGGHFQTERAALRRFTTQFRAALARRRWSVSVDFCADEPDPMCLK